MNQTLKTAIKIIIPIIFLIVGIFLGQDLANLSKIVDTTPQTDIKAQGQAIVASLMLDYGDGRVATYNNIKLEETKTVFELLKKVTSDFNIEFSYSDRYKDLGVFIESIDNVRNDTASDNWWHYWVNNDYADVAADKLELKNGDIVEWKFIRNQFDMEER